MMLAKSGSAAASVAIAQRAKIKRRGDGATHEMLQQREVKLRNKLSLVANVECCDT